jgi:hypothetical protein
MSGVTIVAGTEPAASASDSGCLTQSSDLSDKEAYLALLLLGE